MRRILANVVGVLLSLSISSAVAAQSAAPPSPEVTAAMQPYLDSYKLAGMIGIIADKTGQLHYRNVLGYADVEAKRPISENNTFWIVDVQNVRGGVDHDAGG